jgi:hypothetical protein
MYHIRKCIRNNCKCDKDQCERAHETNVLLRCTGLSMTYTRSHPADRAYLAVVSGRSYVWSPVPCILTYLAVTCPLVLWHNGSVHRCDTWQVPSKKKSRILSYTSRSINVPIYNLSFRIATKANREQTNFSECRPWYLQIIFSFLWAFLSLTRMRSSESLLNVLRYFLMIKVLIRFNKNLAQCRQGYCGEHLPFLTHKKTFLTFGTLFVVQTDL